MPQSMLLRSIELYGKEVIPMVKAELGSEIEISF
jgi:hypothetical protein